jgi:hypothetical protein
VLQGAWRAEIARLQKSFADQGINPAVWDGHEEFLRNQDQARRDEVEKSRRDNERETYFYKQRVAQYRLYAGSCTSDRRDCPGPIGEEARRVLGPRNGKQEPGDDTLADFFRDSGRLGAGRMGGLEKSAACQAFIKDPGSCGACHTTK